MTRTHRFPDAAAPVVEWIGERFESNAWISDGAEQYRPHIIVWLNLASGMMLGGDACHPLASQEAAVESLRRAMASGGGPVPNRIRVGDPEMADALQHSFGDEIEIMVGSTKELASFKDQLSLFFEKAGTPPTYTEGGRIPPDRVAIFFEAAAGLYRAEPWRAVRSDAYVLGVDIPQLDREGICLSVIGQAEESFGFILCDDTDEFVNFWRASQQGSEASPEGQATFLALTYVPRRELPRPAQVESKTHSWAVAGPRAWPFLSRFCPDDDRPTLTKTDYRLATIVCRGLTRFVTEHRADIEICTPCGGIYRVEDPPRGETTVKLVAPHPQAVWIDEVLSNEPNLMRRPFAGKAKQARQRKTGEKRRSP